MKTKCGSTNGSRRWSQHAACVSACVVVLCLTPFCWMTAQAQSVCSEPPPVGNAYRKWEQGASNVTYECFPTYELTGGDLYRTCDTGLANFSALANFSGQAPVCTLNCTYTRNETGTSVVNVNGSLALNYTNFSCDNNFKGSENTAIMCSARLGAWNHSAIDCHDPDTVLRSGSAVLDPENSAANLSHATDGNDDTYVTLTPNSTLTFNISEFGGRMEVTSVRLTLNVTSEDPYPACRLTKQGAEYSGHQNKTKEGRLCQRWDSETVQQYNLTDDPLFPANQSLTEAANYCRNPNANVSGPWCFADTGSREECDIPACALLKLHTVYVDKDGVIKTDDCSDQSRRTDSYNIVSNANRTKNWTIGCRSAVKSSVSSRTVPFGHQLRLTMEKSEANVSLHVHEIVAFGREYTAGCGPVKGYWKLELNDAPPSSSNVGSNVTYRCKSGFHYRGGELFSTCEDSRTWSDPDVSQCTDEPNHAGMDGVTALSDLIADDNITLLVDNDLTSCVPPVTSATSATSFNVTINITLSSLVEVSEVLVTTGGSNFNENFSLHIETRQGGRSWSCEKIDRAGHVGTFSYNCPMRPVSDQVVVRYLQETIPVEPLSGWKLCEVKVMGRNFTKALECLQTEEGQDYKGQWSLTVSARECQRWDSSSPHSHTYNTSDLFPDVTIYDASNFCRNPNKPHSHKKRPWCYTTDNETEWEYCPLFLCDDFCLLREDGVNYQGAIRKASSGEKCEGWFDGADSASQLPFLRDHYFPLNWWKVSNRCSNPHGSLSSPWCFTSKTKAEFCDIPTCPEVNDTAFLHLQPDDSSSTPDWLTDSNLTVRECWPFQQNVSDYGGPFTLSVSELLKTECDQELLKIGMFCDFVDGSNNTVWHYFWYNCTFPETTTAATTESVTSAQCDCETACRANLTEEQIQARLQEIKEELLVDSTKLSATIRKKQSATDDRPSAVTTGSFGVAFLVVVFGFIISADVISLFQWLSHRFSGGK